MTKPKSRELIGALFTNKHRENPKQPTFVGECTIDSVEYRIYAYETKSKAGENYIFLTFRKLNRPVEIQEASEEVPDAVVE